MSNSDLDALQGLLRRSRIHSVPCAGNMGLDALCFPTSKGVSYRVSTGRGLIIEGIDDDTAQTRIISAGVLTPVEVLKKLDIPLPAGAYPSPGIGSDVHYWTE